MHQIEKVIRTIKGEKKEVELVFCDGVLTGNPPEIKEVNGGYKVMRGFGFSLKVSNGRNKKPTYYALEFWGDQAEYMNDLGFEGQRIIVTGRKEVSTYNGKEYCNLSVERFSCIDRKEKSDASETSESITEEVKEEKVEVSTSTEDVNSETAKEIEQLAKQEFDDLPF